MKNRTFNYSKITFLLALVFMVTISCERDISDEVEFAAFAKTSEIFTDSPIGLGTDFYFPFTGSKPTAMTFDGEGYESEKSIRIDVPNANDPEGGYAGGILRVDGAGRDLTEFDALTFWAKASQGVTISVLGFGIDFLEDKYGASIENTSIGTNWAKYIIPIPDASKLVEERGMFLYSAGTQNTGGFGYTFWIDDLKFEKLGTIGEPRPALWEGDTRELQVFLNAGGVVGSNSRIVTFNLASGNNVSVIPAPSYFDWTSSEPSVIEVQDGGFLEPLSIGTSVITATLAGVQATGSLILEVRSAFELAPTPPARDPDDVIAIFSDAYNEAPIDSYNGYWEGYQTTQGQNDIYVNDDNIINYTELNYVGIEFYGREGSGVPPINANEMTHFHIDINVREAIQSGDFLKIELINNVGGLETKGTITIDGSQLQSEEWISLDIPLADFAGLSVRNQLGILLFDSGATITNIFLDNIYFYKE